MADDPININPIAREPDVSLGENLPMNAQVGGGFSSTYFTKDQIKANLLNLFLTMLGERVMQPEFGTRLWEYIFEPVNDELKKVKIKNELKRAVNLWMPMVKIDEITFPTDANEHKVYVKVFYRVPNYNLLDELKLEVQ